ncbi:MAG: DUF327 domain-containing protein [Fretibacterium sp.]|uniref:DUF327 domain-containing protein n=1 Tax=Fretibacterium sp. OH1220_COT-178 TaxID=2491047 RepID=UPI000F5F2157|nr:DUF327 domain-containing protein [Fretibacterium sp. OH1220_COT-178]MDO4785520.1 DUF327 domain-containing protein [Fretibacterium sp.]RRD64127.1 DUF327 domain-containing protein [Fretibacterium sp. OH1220_COT-178]
MRVKRSGEGAKGRVEYGGGGGGRSASAPGSVAAPAPFGLAMEESEIRVLLDRLDAVSARLSVFPAERLIAEYRSILTDLLRRAMKGFSLRRDLRWRKTDRKMFVTIERAEAAMEELEDAFRREGDRSRAIALLEEIKGCLISLLL